MNKNTKPSKALVKTVVSSSYNTQNIMTFEQFDKTGWTGNMKCIFQGEEYGIATVDFEERLVGIYEMISGAESKNDISWKRCENITLVSE